MRPPNVSKLDSLPKRSATFLEPMECASVSKLPIGDQWVFEIKLDGYRAIAVKSGNNVSLLSRRHKSFNSQYPAILEALVGMPDESVFDGEIVALDDSGLPRFNLLQNYRRESDRIRYFVFDLLCYRGRDTTQLPLIERRTLLGDIKFGSPRIQLVAYEETTAARMLEAVRGLGLEGVIGKRKDSPYQPDRRGSSIVSTRDKNLSSAVTFLALTVSTRSSSATTKERI
jgi:bifunctional non-homologous end joining protein LigD